MGSAISSQMKGVMDENMKSQQTFMLDSYQLQLERQIAMQNEMRERQMAMGIARAREVFKYYSSFYGLVAVLSTVGFIKTRKPASLIPLVPLTFVEAYQYDAAHGTLMQRVRGEADSIMKNEPSMLSLPHGLPTFDDVEKSRLSRK